MKELNVFNYQEKLVIESREVAEMVDKQHAHLMRDIKNYCNTLNESKFGLVEFFIESTYKDSKGEVRPCYLLTKKGCDMVANKMTGEKGVLFTATYIDRFYAMEQELKFNLPKTFSEALRLAANQAEKIEQLEIENFTNKQIISELNPKATYYDIILQSNSLVSATMIAKDYGKSAFWLNKELYMHKVIYKHRGTWLLHQKYAEKGYTQTKTYITGEGKCSTHNYWTQKGRVFVYEVLKKRGILPLIELNNSELVKI